MPTALAPTRLHVAGTLLVTHLLAYIAVRPTGKGSSGAIEQGGLLGAGLILLLFGLLVGSGGARNDLDGADRVLVSVVVCVVLASVLFAYTFLTVKHHK